MVDTTSDLRESVLPSRWTSSPIAPADCQIGRSNRQCPPVRSTDFAIGRSPISIRTKGRTAKERRVRRRCSRRSDKLSPADRPVHSLLFAECPGYGCDRRREGGRTGGGSKASGSRRFVTVPPAARFISSDPFMTPSPPSLLARRGTNAASFSLHPPTHIPLLRLSRLAQTVLHNIQIAYCLPQIMSVGIQ